MLSFTIGIILGIVYFGGLYFTVVNINKAKYPGLLMALGFILRMAVLLGVFFYISKNGYKNMIYALIGVIIVRVLMTVKLKNQPTNSTKKE